MSKDLFRRVKSLLCSNEILHGTEEAQAIIEEIDLLLKSDELKAVEQHIADAERKVVSEDIADEILNGKYCVGGNCED